MKVGDYVRTKRGQIGKLEKIEDKNCEIEFNRMWKDLILKEDIIKSRPNIKDLIELGDLVRLFMEDNLDEEDTNIFEVIAITDDKKEIGVFTKDCELDFYPIENLRGIVTHEQFSQMEYRIGE